MDSEIPEETFEGQFGYGRLFKFNKISEVETTGKAATKANHKRVARALNEAVDAEKINKQVNPD